MNSRDRIETIRQMLSHSIAAGRMSHAYLIAGHPGTTLPFAEFILRELLAQDSKGEADRTRAIRWIERRQHPDVIWVEPESKSRVIIKDQIKELGDKIVQTAFFGGWRAAVIIDADRMNPAASNAFLKTLEEPPAKSLLLLLSSHPEELLPTIRSRCQVISINSGESPQPAEWGEDLLDILRAGHPADPLRAVKSAELLQGLLEREKEAATEAAGELEEDAENSAKEIREARISSRVIGVRHDIMKWFIMWHRDVLFCVLGSDPDTLHFPQEAEHLRKQAEGLSCEDALKILEEAQDLAARLERMVPDRLLFQDSMISQAALAYRARSSRS